MESISINTDAKHIRRFLDTCDGNWHNCVHISCVSCQKTKVCKESGFLLCPDASAVPLLLPCSAAKILFSCQTEPEECLLSITMAQFLSMYGNYIGKQFSDGKCTCMSMLKTQEASNYDWQRSLCFTAFLRTTYIKGGLHLSTLILQWLDQAFIALAFLPIAFTVYCRFTSFHKKSMRKICLYRLCVLLTILFVLRCFCGKFIFTEINRHRFTDSGLFPLIEAIFYPEV